MWYRGDPRGFVEVAVRLGFAIVAASKTFANPQSDPGTVAIRWIEVDATNDSFAIHLTGPAPCDVDVAWLVLE